MIPVLALGSKAHSLFRGRPAPVPEASPPFGAGAALAAPRRLQFWREPAPALKKRPRVVLARTGQPRRCPRVGRLHAPGIFALGRGARAKLDRWGFPALFVRQTDEGRRVPTLFCDRDLRSLRERELFNERRRGWSLERAWITRSRRSRRVDAISIGGASARRFPDFAFADSRTEQLQRLHRPGAVGGKCRTLPVRFSQMIKHLRFALDQPIGPETTDSAAHVRAYPMFSTPYYLHSPELSASLYQG